MEKFLDETTEGVWGGRGCRCSEQSFITNAFLSASENETQIAIFRITGVCSRATWNHPQQRRGFLHPEQGFFGHFNIFSTVAINFVLAP